MSKVAIVYHSGYGHTQALAEAVAKGAESVAGTGSPWRANVLAQIAWN